MAPIEAGGFPTWKAERLTEEEIQRIKSFKVPDFKSPYPSKANQHGEKARANASEWVKQKRFEKMYKSPEVMQAALDADVHGLATHAYEFVDHAEKGITWAAKMYLVLFAFDDHIDDGANFFTLDLSGAASLILELNLMVMWSFPDDPQLRKNLLAVLDDCDVAQRDAALKYLDGKLAMARLQPGSVYDPNSPQIEPLVKAFADLWAQMWESMSCDFMLRWGRTFQLHVLSHIQEIRNRDSKVIPPIDEYVILRRKTIGASLAIVMAEFVGQAQVPSEVFNTPEFQRMIDAFSDILLYVQDIFSFKKEALNGDVHNLVIMLSHERGCSYEEAGTIIHGMWLDRVENQEKSFQILERTTPPEHKHGVAQYINCAKSYNSSSFIEWHAKSRRYQV